MKFILTGSGLRKALASFECSFEMGLKLLESFHVEWDADALGEMDVFKMRRVLMTRQLDAKTELEYCKRFACRVVKTSNASLASNGERVHKTSVIEITGRTLMEARAELFEIVTVAANHRKARDLYLFWDGR